MWKVWGTALVGALLSIPVAAKDTLAILPTSGTAEGETIAERFSFEPVLTGVFNIIPRTSINRAIEEE